MQLNDEYGGVNYVPDNMIDEIERPGFRALWELFVVSKGWGVTSMGVSELAARTLKHEYGFDARAMLRGV